MMNINSTPDLAVQEAIEWMVFLRSGEATDTDFKEFESWSSANPANTHACQQIEVTLGKIQNLAQLMPNKDIQTTLMAPSSRRKFLHNSFFAAAVIGSSGLLLNREYSVNYLLSDAYTNTAQRKTIQLDDGSHVNMNARSAIDINYDSEKRLIMLKGGGIITNVIKGERPFIIKTKFGNIITLNSRLNISKSDEGIHLAVLDSVAKIINNDGVSSIIRKNQGAWFSGRKIIPITVTPSAETAWLEGKLEVNNATLASVVEALQNYTPAFIHLHPKVRHLRVSGVFPLDDVFYSLDSLSQTMPIAITRTTDYFLQIKPARV